MQFLKDGVQTVADLAAIPLKVASMSPLSQLDFE